jgi:hypothetical protein
MGIVLVAAAILTATPDAKGPESVPIFAVLNLGLLAMALVGAFFEDPFATQLRRLTAAALAILCLAAEARAREGLGFLCIPVEFVTAYSLLLVGFCMVWGSLTASRPYFGVAIIGLSALLTSRGFRMYGDLRRQFEGLDWIVLGLIFFVVAALISFGKTDAARKWFPAPSADGVDESLGAG